VIPSAFELENGVLAGLQDYLGTWQIPLFVALLVGWLWGGGWLLHRSLLRRGYPKRIRRPRCVLIFLLGGLAGSAAGAVFFKLFHTAGDRFDTNLLVPGMAAATVVLFGVAFLIIYAMLELSLPAALKASAVPMLAMFLWLAAVATSIALPAYIIRMRDNRRASCHRQLFFIYDELARYQLRFGAPAPNLQALVDLNYLDAKYLTCPAEPDKKPGYFYLPATLQTRGDEAERIILCDFRGNHSGGRNVLLASGQPNWYSTAEFEDRLTRELNAEFAAALARAEGR